jgi:glycosyltransferase involved in cell wall biosynthesis
VVLASRVLQRFCWLFVCTLLAKISEVDPTRLPRPMDSQPSSQSAFSRCPRVSVVIPTLNRAAMLQEAVASVLAQSFRDFEIIVVDDGSTDGTAAWIGRQSEVRGIFQPRGGVAAARNAGIGAARGQFLCFLDDDDVWERGKLALQVAYLDAHPDCALVASEMTAFDHRGLIPLRSTARRHRIRNGCVARDLLFANWIQTSSVMVRRTCLDAVGLFDQELFDQQSGSFDEDWHLWVRIAARFPIAFMPEPLIRFRLHGASLTAAAPPESQFESLLHILEKLAAIEPFCDEPWLIDHARYRFCLSYAAENAKAGDRALAREKLRLARSLFALPVRAWIAIARLGLDRPPQSPRPDMRQQAEAEA